MSLYQLGCPNIHCSDKFFYKKDGYYFRKNDSRKIQRFRCLSCGKKFSVATHQLECGHKKRRVNFPLLKLLASGNSQRRCAILLKINHKTVARKLEYLAKKYSQKNKAWLLEQKLHSVKHVQFDDLITIEHTKLKPLAVTAMVDTKTRKILAVEVSQIPAFGRLASLSVEKYGKRTNEHPVKLAKLFSRVQQRLDKNVLIESDENPSYPLAIAKFCPNAKHKRYKGGRGCITGQGELKKLHYDPLFCINHTYAMFRANVNRLFRRSWCTTKKEEKLQEHLEVFVWYYNHVLLS